MNKRRKLVFIVDRNSYNSIDHIGVRKKINEQLLYFESLGFLAKLVEYDWINGYISAEIGNEIDVLYMRHVEPSIKLYLKLREWKRQNKHLRILMEIPTYPFKGEQLKKDSIKHQVSNMIGALLIKKVIDRMVVLGEAIDRLYGIPVIHASNGVNVSQTVPVEWKEHNDSIHLIAVSGCYFWHGYERIIEGLGQYYLSNPSIKVILHMVGVGDCSQLYNDVAKKYDLINKGVFFHGILYGEDLDMIYNQSDIVVGELAIHRKGISLSASLKSREGMAKGLPYITASKPDIGSDELLKYICIVPSDDSDININDIIVFYRRVYNKDRMQVQKNIRRLAKQYFGWDYVFKDVANYLIGE